MVDAKPSFGGVTPVGVSNTASLENAGARENTVRILFKNIYTAALNDPGKTQVKKRPVPLGALPTDAWVDDPCRSVTDPVSIEYSPAAVLARGAAETKVFGLPTAFMSSGAAGHLSQCTRTRQRCPPPSGRPPATGLRTYVVPGLSLRLREDGHFEASDLPLE